MGTILLEGYNTRGEHVMCTYYTDRTIIYAVTISATGRLDKTREFKLYTIEFSLKDLHLPHFDKVVFEFKVKRPEHIRVILGIINKYIDETIKVEQPGNLFINIEELVKDTRSLDVMTDNLARVMEDDMKQAEEAIKQAAQGAQHEQN